MHSYIGWGPSWAHTAYPFKTADGKLLRMIKAANGIPNQICRHLSMHQCESIFMNRIILYVIYIISYYIPGSSDAVKAYCYVTNNIWLECPPTH